MSNRTLRDVRRRGDIVLARAPDFQGGQWRLERDGGGGLRLVPDRPAAPLVPSKPPGGSMPSLKNAPSWARGIWRYGRWTSPYAELPKIIIGAVDAAIRAQPDATPVFSNCGAPVWCTTSTGDGCMYLVQYPNNLFCLGNQAATGPACPADAAPAVNFGMAQFVRRVVVPGLWRADTRWYMRYTGGGVPVKEPVLSRPKSPYVPATPGPSFKPAAPYAVPRWPALAPEEMPIGQPAPTPLPIPRDLLPYRTTNPWRVESEQSQWGYGSWYGIDLFEPVMREADRRSRPGASYEIVPGAKPKLVPPEHKFAPPKPGEKERKTRVGSALSRAILRAVNFTTEEFDLIDALYKAVPKDCKRAAKRRYDLRGLKQLRPQHKAQVVFHCLHEIPWRDAVREIAKNEVEDLIYGKIGQELRRLNRKSGALTGVQRGPGGFGKVPDKLDRKGNPVEHITELVGDVVDFLTRNRR